MQSKPLSFTFLNIFLQEHYGPLLSVLCPFDVVGVHSKDIQFGNKKNKKNVITK